jgi:hypothetical protein
MRLKDIFILYSYLFLISIALLYFYIIGFQEEINLNWEDYKCKPYIAPIAGYVKTDKNKDPLTLSMETFEDCMIQLLIPTVSDNINTQISPSLGIFGKAINKGTDAVQSVFRVLITSLRKLFTSIMSILIGVVSSSLQPFAKILISVQTISKRIVAIMTGIIYTLVTAVKLQESIFNYMIKILEIIGKISLGISFIFPPAGILFHMIKTGTKGFIRFCFHPLSIIHLKNTFKSAKDIQCGDILEDGSIVTTTFKLKTQHKPLVKIGKIVCTHDHKVKNHLSENWIHAATHHKSKNVLLDTDYLICWNTTTGRFKQDNVIYADYEDGELQDNIEGIKSCILLPVYRNNKYVMTPICDIQIGDIIGYNRAIVQGICKTKAKLDDIVNGYFGINTKINGKLVETDILNENRDDDILYQFITDKKTIDCKHWSFENYENDI